MNELKKWLTILGISAAAVAIIYVLVANLSPDKDEMADENTNITLTDFATKLPRTIDFSEKPTVLQVFTSWCPYCNEDAPKVVELQEKYKDEVNIYGINLYNRDTEDDLADYMDKYHIAYPVLLDEDGKVYDSLGNTGFPALFIMTSKGEVAASLVGATEQSKIDDFIKYASYFH